MKSYLNLSFLILLCLISLQIHASRCGEQPNRACQSDCYRDKCCQNPSLYRAVGLSFLA